MRTHLTIATRGSKLALWQANHISSLLTARYPGLEVALNVIKTKGDKILDVPLAKVGGKGLFVKEIEEALTDFQADLAVHSMKDVPAERAPGLTLGVIPEREAIHDVLLTREYPSLASLPQGARVGTSSLRRKAQLHLQRKDLDIVDLRGNLDTRVGKLMAGDYDAIVVAGAGLNRLGLTAPYAIPLAPPEFLPAAGQGALGVEYREGDRELAEMLAFLDHPDSRDPVLAERGFLTGLDGGCQVPIAAHARITGPDSLALTGFVSDVAGERVFRLERAGARADAFEIGRDLARDILAAGGKAVLDELYGESA